MQGDTFFKTIFYFVIYPVWYLILGIGWLIKEFVIIPLWDNHQISKASARETIHDAFNVEAVTEQFRINNPRPGQYEALKAAMPSTSVERMRATIHFNEARTPIFDVKRVPRGRGFDLVRYYASDRTDYYVDMALELPERDRGIILQHNLALMVMEEYPKYTPDELSKIERENYEETEARKSRDNPINSNQRLVTAMGEATKKLYYDRAKTQKIEVLLGDYLVIPYSRTFASSHEAKLYGDKLRGEILPKIRTLIDSYAEHKQSQTLEF